MVPNKGFFLLLPGFLLTSQTHQFIWCVIFIVNHFLSALMLKNKQKKEIPKHLYS